MGTLAEKFAKPPTPPPEAPPAPTPLADAFAEPSREVNVPTRGLTTDPLVLARMHKADAVYQQAREVGASEDEARRQSGDAYQTGMVVGDEADSAAVRSQLEAHEGPDTTGKMLTRAFGRGVMVTPLASPGKEERDRAYEQRVRENEAALGGLGAVGALASAVKGEKAEAAPLAQEQQSAWLRKALTESANWLAAKSSVAHGVSELWDMATGEPLFGEAPTTDELLTTLRQSSEEMKADPNMQALQLVPKEGEIPGAQGVRVAGAGAMLAARALSKTPLGDVAGSLRKGLGLDEGETLLMWDDAQNREAFDQATADLYSGSGTRTAVDALPIRELPARLRGATIDIPAFQAAVAAGDPDLAPLQKAVGRGDDSWIGVIESLPVDVAARYQPDLRPTDDELHDAIKARHAAAKWSGAPQAAALENLMVAGFMKPLDNGKDALFVPSRFQDLMRVMAVPFAAVAIEPDIHPWTLVSGSPVDAPEQGDTSLTAKLRAARIPTVRGVESLVESGAYNDWLASAGLFGGGDGYNAPLSGPSGYLARVLSDAAMGDYGARGYEDIYERAGGDPHSAVAKTLSTIDLALQFLIPAEDVVTVPMGATLRAGNRARVANRALRELGVPAKDARIAAVGSAIGPWVSSATDPIQALGDSTRTLIHDRFKSGELDPDALTPANLAGLKDLFVSVGVKDPDATLTGLLDHLRDRRMRVLDTAAEGLRTGGPQTRALRDSRAYKDTEAALTRMVGTNFKNAAERDMALATLETDAFRAWDNGDIATPAEYFERQMWTKANPEEEAAEAAGREGLGEGTLRSRAPEATPVYQGGDLPDAAKDILARLDDVGFVRGDEIAGWAADPRMSLDELIDGLHKDVDRGRREVGTMDAGTVAYTKERLAAYEAEWAAREDGTTTLRPDPDATRMGDEELTDKIAELTERLDDQRRELAGEDHAYAEAHRLVDQLDAALRGADIGVAPVENVVEAPFGQPRRFYSKEGGTTRGSIEPLPSSPSLDAVSEVEVFGFDPDSGVWRVEFTGRDGRVVESRSIPDADLERSFDKETARRIREKAKFANGESFSVSMPNPFTDAVRAMESDALVDVLRNLPTDDPVLTRVAQHLVENGDLHHTTVSVTPDPVGGTTGVYLDQFNTVQLASRTATPHTLVHEALHAATARAIHNPTALSESGQAAVRDLHTLFDKVKRAAKDMDYAHYGLTNIDEFIAESFSSDTFQEFLANLYVGNTDASLWTEFVRTIGRIFGFEDASALAEVLTIGERIIKEPQAPLPRDRGALLSREAGTTRGAIQPIRTPEDPRAWMPSGHGVPGTDPNDVRAVRPYLPEVREVAHGVKAGNPGAIRRAAAEMAPLVPDADVLVPVPSSTGDTTITRTLAEAIAAKTGARVADVLTGDARPSQYTTKASGSPELLAPELRMRLREGQTAPTGRVFLVDNVIGTGNTFKAAQSALDQPAGIIAYSATTDPHLAAKGAWSASGTDSPWFRRWFGDSKVVDAEGKPLVVYHGTDRSFDAFDEAMVANGSHYGPGFYFSDRPASSAIFAGKKDGASIIPVRLAIRNPLELHATVPPTIMVTLAERVPDVGSAISGRRLLSKLYGALGEFEGRKVLESVGIDGLVDETVVPSGTERTWVAFHPEQIKSATANVGTFDPNDPSILRSQSTRGAITPVPTTKDVPNPARESWVAEGRAAAERVKALEKADAERLAQLETTRNALRDNPQPSDREWRTELDAAEEALADFKPSPEYAAAVAELARMRKAPPTKSLTVPDRARWLIRLFKTGDILTAFHEGAHLAALMGPEWERMAARVFDSVDGKLTVKGHEQLAEASVRILRGKFRPGSVVDNLTQDVLDAVGDVWRRVRSKPFVEHVPQRMRRALDALPDNAIPAEFARMWDQQFSPERMATAEAVHIVDGQGRAFPAIVNVEDTPGARVLESKSSRAGQAQTATSIARNPEEVRVSLGLKAGEQSVDPVEFLSNAMAYLATERFRRAWGASGPLKMLPSGRTAVPEARHAKVIADADARRVAAMGGRPSPIQGTNDLALTPGQQAGLRRVVREVADSPLGDALPASLTEPGADLSRIAAEDYNTLTALHTDLSAGWGAWRETRAERAATSGATRILTAATDYARKTDAKPAIDSVQRAFDSSFGVNEAMQPHQAEFMRSIQRELAAVPAQVDAAIAQTAQEWRKGGTKFKAIDLVRETAKGIPPEVVPPDYVDDLAQVEPLLLNGTLEGVAASAEQIDNLFAKTPLDDSAGDMRIIESDAVRRLDDLHRAFMETNDMEAALAATGETPRSASDAMQIVTEGIRRRSASVQDIGRDITLTFFGSNDLTGVEKLQDPAVRAQVFRNNYVRWFEGDWVGILDDIESMRGGVSGQKYDQGSAALSVTIRLNARKVLRDAAGRMAAAGLTGDVANMARNRGGKGVYTAGKLAQGLEAFQADVASYIATISGWTVGQQGFVDDAGQFVTLGGAGRRTAREVEDPVAYDEACRQMARFGVKPTNVTSWDAMDMPGGGRILAPRFVLDNIKTVLEEAAPLDLARKERLSFDPRVGDIVPGSAAQRPPTADVKAINAGIYVLQRMWGYSGAMLRRGLLTGIGPIVKPAYFVTQFVGGINALHQRLGTVGALRVLASPVIGGSDATVVRNVMARLYGPPDILSPTVAGFWTKDGRWITDQMISADMARSGMVTSQPKAEFTTSLIENIAVQEPTAWNNLNRLRLPGTRAWREMVDNAATGIDNMYRVATYVDALKSGVAVEEAGRIARDVAYDFNDLTDFEKKYMRKAVLFYTFQRRNQDAFWRTLLNNPARLTGELRLLNGLQRQELGEDSEIYANPYGDGRLALRFRDALVEGHAANAQRGALTISPGLNVGDQVGLWLDILGTAGGLLHGEVDRASVGRLTGRLAPGLQAIPAAAGFDVERMRLLEDTPATVPQVVVDTDYALSSLFTTYDDEMLGGALTRDVFQARPVRPWDDADAPTGSGLVYEVNRKDPGAAFCWWAFNNLVPYGAVATQAQNYERAAGVIAPRAGVTQGEEAAGLFGFRTTPVQSRAKVLGGLIDRRAKELEDEARAAEATTIVGPRE